MLNRDPNLNPVHKESESMQNLYQKLFDYSPHPIVCHKVICNEKGNVMGFERMLANQAFLGMFGNVLRKITYTEGMLDGLNFFMLMSKVWANHKSEVLEHHFKGIAAYQRLEIRKLDDSVIVTSWLHVDQKTASNQNIDSSQSDNSPSVFLEDESIRKLSRAVEQSPVSIVITDTDGFIEYVNPVFYELTGYTRDEVLGKNPKILQSGMVPKEDYVDLWETILSEHIWKGEFINKKKNGELYFESATIAPVLDSDGQITHFVAIKQDITKNKKYEQDLIDAHEKARESDILKAAFLQNMSHEIRTPMNAIQGFSELAKMSGTSSEKRNSYLVLLYDYKKQG
jgi:PAS domain S-box-containing protein